MSTIKKGGDTIESNWIKPLEASKLLGVSYLKVTRMAAEGKIRSTHDPVLQRSTLVWRPDIENLLRRRRDALGEPD